MATYAYGASGAPSANLGNPSVIDLVLGGTYVNTATGEIWHRINATGIISGSHFALACNTNNTDGDCNLQDATEVNFAGGIGFPGTVNTVDEALTYLVGLDICGGNAPSTGGVEYSTTFVVAASNSTLRARTYADFICTGTNDNVMIQAAINEITDSTYRRIILMEGDYYIDGTITLTGNTVIEGQGESQVILHTNTLDFSLDAFNLTDVNNITFKNFKIQGDNLFIRYIFSCININNIIWDNINVEGHYAYASMDLYNYTNIVVRNCKFMNNRWAFYAINFYTPNTDQNYGIYITDNIFKNSSVTACDAISIDVEWNADNTVPTYSDKRVRQVIITNNSYRGYTTGAYSGRGQFCYVNYADNIVIANNSIEWAGYAISFSVCTSISVTGNTITECEVGIYANGDNWEVETGGGQYIWQITGNTIRDAYQGIAVVGNYSALASYTRTSDDRRAYGLISGNSIKADGSGALSLQVAADFNVTGNFLQCIPTYGIEILDCWEINFTGNFIYGSLHGIDIASSYDLVFTGNFITESTNHGIRIGGGTDIVIKDNYFIENGLQTTTTYDHINFYNYWDIDYLNTNVEIVDNTFKNGYKTNKPRYCVNVNSSTATGILIHGNNFKDGATTGTINVVALADVTHYDNWTANGLSRSLYAGASNNKTIATDAITLLDNTSLIRLIPQAGNTDDLITINGGFDGQIIYLQTNNSSYTITLKSTGNLTLNGGDVSLSATNIIQPLLYSGLLSKWVKA